MSYTNRFPIIYLVGYRARFPVSLKLFTRLLNEVTGYAWLRKSVTQTVFRFHRIFRGEVYSKRYGYVSRLPTGFMFMLTDYFETLSFQILNT